VFTSGNKVISEL